ncbi:hypothetical protein C3B55_00494 [Candidatus Pseudomonas adelgestsugas]|uniref:Uncharacterized protein n=1 Tax=Candidatus Pseudomonas adelgestsugas TaxID=1302376 RepID=A0ABX5R861_9PSED|nr:hypothetical protein C3B55_00494 [Candidatus Pseudomonas adelgestsugas]
MFSSDAHNDTLAKINFNDRVTFFGINCDSAIIRASLCLLVLVLVVFYFRLGLLYRFSLDYIILLC